MFGRIIYIKNEKLKSIVLHTSMTFCIGFVYAYVEAYRDSSAAALTLLNKALIFSIVLSLTSLIIGYFESRHIQNKEKNGPEEQKNL